MYLQGAKKKVRYWKIEIDFAFWGTNNIFAQNVAAGSSDSSKWRKIPAG